MERKEKKITLKLQYFNVVIFPKERQDPQIYISLLDKIRNDKVTINTYQDKQMRILSLEQKGELYVGVLANYVQLDDALWFDEETEKRMEVNIDKRLHPNYKEWEFYFLPSVHCLCVDARCYVSQTRTFFRKAFEQVLANEDDMYVNIEFITSSETLDMIFASKALVKLEIDVSYSNNDNNEAWESLMDTGLKDSNVDKFKGTFRSLKNKVISLSRNTFIGGLLLLSRKNGSAKAQIRDGSKVRTINTNSHPQIDTFKVNEGVKYSAITEAMKKVAGYGED